MIKNPGMRNLRGSQRRLFLQAVGALGAAYGLDRARILNYLSDNGGEALAGAAACASCCRSVHIVAGNGSLAWFQQLWPQIAVATATDSASQSNFAYYSYANAGTHIQADGNGNHEFYYAPDAPSVSGGVPAYPMTAIMAGQNETHTPTPTTAAMVSSANSMLATVASIQAANPVLLPVIGVEPFTFGAAPGAPAVATVPDATGLVGLFNSQASLTTLAAQTDKNLFETYYKADLGLREASARPTVAHYLDTPKTAAYLVGQNLASQLTPTAADLMRYGVPALQSDQNVSTPGISELTNLAQCLITTVKAFASGLTNCVIIGLSPGPTTDQQFTDPHKAFTNMTMMAETVKYFGIILSAFYADLAATADPLCNQKLDKTTVFTVHGDTPHDPFTQAAWPDATPNTSNWIYVQGAGYLKTGWFGNVMPPATAGGMATSNGFDPVKGTLIPGQAASLTTNVANAAVAYAVCQGSTDIVAQYYTGGPYTALINTAG